MRPIRSRASLPIASALLLLGAAARAQEAAPAAPAIPRGRVVEIVVPANSLAGNLLGTPTEQAAAIYLPPGYEGAPERRYPVIYLLHGIFDRHGVWIEAFGVPEILDLLIAEERIPEVIVLMPDGGNRYGGGFYRNSPVAGKWEDFVAVDLVDFVDASFRTLARPGGRAVVGHSMGGYGAVHLGMERPDRFSVAYAMSPCCAAPVDDLGFGNDAWKRAYRMETPEAIDQALEGNDFYPVAALGVLAAFSPAPGKPPLFVDFPFEVVRGEVVLDQAEYARYLAAFPLYRVAETRDALTRLRALALDYGIGDQFLHIPEASRELSHRLAELRVPHRFEVYDGDHRKQLPERLESVVLPYVAAALDRPE